LQKQRLHKICLDSICMRQNESAVGNSDDVAQNR
jgi:hypothetical protein